jgi:hypothetical protein
MLLGSQGDDLFVDLGEDGVEVALGGLLSGEELSRVFSEREFSLNFLEVSLGIFVSEVAVLEHATFGSSEDLDCFEELSDVAGLVDLEESSVLGDLGVHESFDFGHGGEEAIGISFRTRWT